MTTHVILALLLSLTACGGGQPERPVRKAAPAAAPTGPVPTPAGALAGLPAGDTSVVALYRGGHVTRTLFDRYLTFMRRRTAAEAATPAVFIPSILRRCASDILLAQEAQQKGLDQTQDYQFTVADQRETFLLQRWYQRQVKVPSEQAVTEEQVRAAYDAVAATQYAEPAQYRFRHIFFDAHTLPETAWAVVQASAEAVLQQLRDGADFPALAQRYSAAANPGAEVGPVAAGKISAALEAVLAALQPGQYSDVVRTRYGYEILRLEALTPAGVRPFESVKDNVRRLAVSREEARRYAALVQDLRRNREITINPLPAEAIRTGTGGVIIQIDNLWTLTCPEMAARLARGDQDTYADHPRAYLDRLVSERLSVQQAESLGIGSDPDFRAETAFWNTFQLAYLALHARTAATPEVTSEDLAQELAAHSDQYQSPRRIHVRRVTVSAGILSASNPAERYLALERARARAGEALTIVRTGADFGEVALRYSSGPEAKNGGDMGWLAAREAGRVLWDTLTGMQPGQMTELVDDPGRGEVFFARCEGIQESAPLPQPTAEPMMRSMVIVRKRHAMEEAAREELLTAFQFQPNQPVLDAYIKEAETRRATEAVAAQKTRTP